jgi:hypothetical protein
MRKQQQELQKTYQFDDKESLYTTLTCDVKFPETEVHLEWKLSRHGQERSQERNISYEHMMMVMEYGEAFFKQGRIFYVATAKCLPWDMESHLKYWLENIVVVVSKDSSIITCYKAKNGIKHIKHKSKRLRKERSFTKNEQTSNRLAA